ncbi:MAG TPA: LCP family protein [Solirubrobacteraceae bacterium]|nr:LCP family protein [Solirubrobacteraceae bacterium]
MKFLFPSSRGGALWRFALAAAIVVAFTATTTAVAGLLEFKQIAKDISATPPITHARVVIPNPGNPQTILILGSDHRAGEAQSAANTDTIMLVRLDASSSSINVMSVPRDLMVNIPLPNGLAETGKVNAAYSLGGPNLVVKTLQQNVFPELQVNHIVDINFSGFVDLVNAIGCVYTQVDHRYYNNTAYTNYSSIDIEPGYQKLCGTDALSYVRFRHTDNDLVRAARQQAFVRDAKDQYGQSNLIANRGKLLKIFGQHTRTDANLHSIDGLINLFNLVAFSDGHAIKQIPFPTANIADVVNGIDYVTADTGAEQAAFNKFMASTGSGSTTTTATTSTPAAPAKPARAPTAGLIPDLKDGKAQAAALGHAGVPVYVPRRLAAGSAYCSGALGNCPAEIPTVGAYPRKYQIRTPQHHAYPAYQMTVELNATLGQYYDIEGMGWQHPPILAGPSVVRVVGGKRLNLYFEGSKLGVVAWHTARGVYWISNTLTHNLDKQQMIGLAASLVRVP